MISSLSVLHSLEHPERFTELSREEKGEERNRGDLEKKRGKREIEVTRDIRRELKRGESSLACNQFPICSPQSGTLSEVHRVP